jgi:hypothetical protein
MDKEMISPTVEDIVECAAICLIHSEYRENFIYLVDYLGWITAKIYLGA